MFNHLRKRWTQALKTPTAQEANANDFFSSQSQQTTPSFQSDFGSNEGDENSYLPASSEKASHARKHFSPSQNNRSLTTIDTTNRSDPHRFELSNSVHVGEKKQSGTGSSPVANDVFFGHSPSFKYTSPYGKKSGTIQSSEQLALKDTRTNPCVFDKAPDRLPANNHLQKAIPCNTILNNSNEKVNHRHETELRFGEHEDDDDDGIPAIEFSQSLPSTTDEMMHPMNALSYRMRGINEPPQKTELEPNDMKECFDFPPELKKCNDAYGRVGHDYVSDENAFLPYRSTQFEQQWFSPRKKWCDGDTISPTPSLPEISISRSMLSPDDLAPESTKIQNRKYRYSCRESGGTPMSIVEKKYGRSRRDKNRKARKIAAVEKAKLDVADTCNEDIKSIGAVEAIVQVPVKPVFSPKNSRNGINERIISPAQGQLSIFKPSPLALRRVFVAVSGSDENKNMDSSSHSQNTRNSKSLFQGARFKSESTSNDKSTMDIKKKNSSLSSDDESEDHKRKIQFAEDENDTPSKIDDDYSWAYEVWKRKGLLQQSVISSPDMVDKNSTLVEIGEPVLPKHFSPADRQEDVNRAIGLVKKPLNKIKERKSLPVYSLSNPKKRSDESNQSFANVLKQWRLVSDDKPCSHFLSPDSQQSHFGKSNTETVTMVRVPRHRSGRVNAVDSNGPSDSAGRNPEVKDPTSVSGIGISMRGDGLQYTSVETTMVRATGESKQGDTTEMSQTTPPSGIMEYAEKSSKILLSSTMLLQRSRMRTPKSRRDFKTVVKEFLNESDTGKSRSKSVPPSRRPTNTTSQPTSGESSTQILKKCERTTPAAAVAASILSNQSELKRTNRSKSLPRLRENSQMAESLTNLRPKLTKEYSDDLKLNDTHVHKPTRRVLDLLDNDFKSITPLILSEEPMTTTTNINHDTQYPEESSDFIIRHNDNEQSPKSQISEGSNNIDEGSPTTHASGQVESVRTSELCRCSSSIFSGSNDMVEFYLPLTGTFCGCGHRPPGLRRPDEPTSLNNILRPWQVKFLGSYGIYLGDQLVKAHHRSAKDLAKALYRYRKKNNMKLFDLKTCSSALKIWAKTSKSFVRSIRAQIAAGTLTSEFVLPTPVSFTTSVLQCGLITSNRRPSMSTTIGSMESPASIPCASLERRSNHD